MGAITPFIVLAVVVVLALVVWTLAKMGQAGGSSAQDETAKESVDEGEEQQLDVPHRPDDPFVSHDPYPDEEPDAGNEDRP